MTFAVAATFLFPSYKSYTLTNQHHSYLILTILLTMMIRKRSRGAAKSQLDPCSITIFPNARKKRQGREKRNRIFSSSLFLRQNHKFSYCHIPFLSPRLFCVACWSWKEDETFPNYNLNGTFARQMSVVNFTYDDVTLGENCKKKKQRRRRRRRNHQEKVTSIKYITFFLHTK